MLKWYVRLAMATIVAAILLACSEEPTAEVQFDSNQPVGLGLYFVNGQWNPDVSSLTDPSRPTALEVIRGHKRVVQELYISSVLPTTEADGPDPLVDDGDFAGLDWSGLYEYGEDWRLEANGATYQHQVFYRGAAWMEEPSKFTVTLRDSSGRKLERVKLSAGKADRAKNNDDFGERRFIVRVLSSGCASVGDCSAATHFAQALVQLRVALHSDSFRIPEATTSLEVTWSAYEDKTYSVPVVVREPTGDIGHGLKIQLTEAAPQARGYYLPGEPVAVRMTYTDGDGTPLFAPGFMPSYGAAMARLPDAQGLRYLSFAATPMLYYALKPQQGAMETFLAGPVHRMTTVGSTPITPYSLFAPEIPAATRAIDGWTSIIQETPITPVMFGCLLGYDPSACSLPTPDVFVFTLPADAESGTYVAGVKARREWMGEPSTAAASIRVQVGQTAPTTFPGFEVDGLEACADCHSGPMALSRAGHGFAVDSVSAECLACHTDGYYFEPDAGIVTRLQFLHGESGRL